MTGAIILSAIITVFAFFFTLAWWRIADRWADSEHKRFKPKPKDQAVAPRVIQNTDTTPVESTACDDADED